MESGGLFSCCQTICLPGRFRVLPLLSIGERACLYNTLILPLMLCYYCSRWRFWVGSSVWRRCMPFSSWRFSFPWYSVWHPGFNCCTTNRLWHVSWGLSFAVAVSVSLSLRTGVREVRILLQRLSTNTGMSAWGVWLCSAIWSSSRPAILCYTIWRRLFTGMWRCLSQGIWLTRWLTALASRSSSSLFPVNMRRSVGRLMLCTGEWL